MRVFVGLSFDAENHTAVVCCHDDREACRRAVELYRREMLSWSPYGVDGPDGGASLDDARGDAVGRVIAFDVGGDARLNWCIDLEMGHLFAPSTVFEDDGEPVPYTIFGEGSRWTVDFNGASCGHGTLEQCMTLCRKLEDDAILQAVQNQQEHDESWPRDSDKHGALLATLKRFLDPEDLGRDVSAYARDEVRVALGYQRVESK